MLGLDRIKQTLTLVLSKFLQQPRMQDFLNDKVRVGSQPLPTLKNIDSPYQKVSAVPNLTSQRDDIIFITSRFRSGSTLLWNLFRQSGTCTSFYEPFNERQWFSPKLRGENVDASHRGVSDYWAEYQGMEELSELYDEDWIRTELLMTEQSHQPKMKRFIERLVELSPKRPVLQFNRIDFRLLWVKQHFPKAKILHLFRHPRDQWCSFLTDDSLMNKNDVELTYQDAFYLDPWCDDLAKHYPFLDKRFTPHPYQRFYALWKLSFLFGKQYADYSVSFEALTEKPKDEINAIFDLFNISVDPFSIEKLCNVIQAPMPARWKNYADEAWFAAHENEVDNLILPFLKR